jgi:hypothetical protein
VFAVSAPEGLHRYLYRVPVPSCRQFDAWVAKEYPLSAAAQRLSRSNLRLDLQQLLTLLFQQRRWLGQARYPASSGNARNLPTASVSCHGYQRLRLGRLDQACLFGRPPRVSNSP